MTEDVKDWQDGTATTTAPLPTGTVGPTLDGEGARESGVPSDAIPSPGPMPKTKVVIDTRPLTLPPVDKDVSRFDDMKLIQTAIECAPDPEYEGRHLPAVRFAETIGVNDRTIRRYQDGSRGLNVHLRHRLVAQVRRAQKVAENERLQDDPVAAWKAVCRAEDRYAAAVAKLEPQDD